jgi:hypothetical protein
MVFHVTCWPAWNNKQATTFRRMLEDKNTHEESEAA